MFLTNALTGWEPRVQKPLPFPELEEERERADRVKQDTPVLVILGNPPYNGFAGMAVEEERELSEAYRTIKQVRRPEGQGLNDLYVRFFRMAERRIAEKTGQGIVCFISNYSWLDRLSFTGMRGALPGGLRRHSHRLSQRRQVQDGQDLARRFAGPQHFLHTRRSGRHPGGHRHHHVGQEGRTRARRDPGLPPPLGTGQTHGVDQYG